MMITHNLNYQDITSLENLFQAWNEFKKGKRKRKDVQLFERNLEDNLFELHPQKIILRKLEWGIDFLGYIVLPHYILPRTKTKRRIFKKIGDRIKQSNLNQIVQSYLGYLSHASSFKLSAELKNLVYLKHEFQG